MLFYFLSFILRFCCLLLFFFVGISSGFSQELHQAHTQLKLVSEQDAVVAGETFWAGFEFVLDRGWHIYAQTHGDVGLASVIRWHLPAGVVAGLARWPEPLTLRTGSLTSFVYENRVLVLVPLRVAQAVSKSSNLHLNADVTWLACRETCVPAHGRVGLSLPFVENISLVGFSGYKRVFDTARRDMMVSRHVAVSAASMFFNGSFFLACVLAFMGGLILNLMPCVLPVLSIKVLHLVERHPDKKIALSHSLMYACGILVSLWALALLLFILKFAGQSAGWGFQFQSPVFVMGVAIILLILALNLFGVFEFNMPFIEGLTVSLRGYPASFVSGVITTIVASPCTAPFMGTALTAAISQPNIVGFGIFTCLGLGLASPFVLLSAFPVLLSCVPKPGPWMIHLKQGLGVILCGCVVWLLWVWGIQTGLGDFSKLGGSSQEIHWQKYSSEAVDQAHRSGQAVFVDFTAAWCLNCQVNDRLVLQDKDLIRVFRDKKIVAFKADWTKYDPEITQALSQLGRDSIPVYVYYAPRSSGPIVLPQLITASKIATVIEEHDRR